MVVGGGGYAPYKHRNAKSHSSLVGVAAPSFFVFHCRIGWGVPGVTNDDIRVVE